MHTFMDAKLMAKLLRQALAERHIELSHSDCLELVSRQFGLKEWNVLAAYIDRAATLPADQMPDGWIKTGSYSRFFEARMDAEPGVVVIGSRPDLGAEIRGEDFCTVMQSVSAEAFKGKRVRVQAELRTRDVTTGATLWFRIDGPRGTLRFDNLEQRPVDGPLSGTTDWTVREVVFDVPDEALSLHYGFFTKGQGTCWARAFDVTKVDHNVPVSSSRGHLLPQPANLTFSRRAA